MVHVLTPICTAHSQAAAPGAIVHQAGAPSWETHTHARVHTHPHAHKHARAHTDTMTCTLPSQAAAPGATVHREVIAKLVPGESATTHAVVVDGKCGCAL